MTRAEREGVFIYGLEVSSLVLAIVTNNGFAWFLVSISLIKEIIEWVDRGEPND